ncbi:MAG: DUF998 domain-containing protein [Candidatus Hodarchaeota archaeon]
MISLIFLLITILTYSTVYPFSIFSNFVSDLGLGPYTTRITFAIGGTLMAASYMVYFLFLSRYIQRRGGHPKIIWIAFFFSLLYALNLILVCIVPFDPTNELAYNIHILGAIFLFLGQAGGGILYGLSELNTKGISILMPLTSFISALLAGIFVFIFTVQSLTLTPYQVLTYLSEWSAVFGLILWTSIHGLYTLND